MTAVILQLEKILGASQDRLHLPNLTFTIYAYAKQGYFSFKTVKVRIKYARDC